MRSFRTTPPHRSTPPPACTPQRTTLESDLARILGLPPTGGGSHDHTGQMPHPATRMAAEQHGAYNLDRDDDHCDRCDTGPDVAGSDAAGPDAGPDAGREVAGMPGWPESLPWPPPLTDADVPVEPLFDPQGVQAAPHLTGVAPARVPLPDPPARGVACPMLTAWQDPDQPPVDLTVINEHPALAELILWLRQIDVLTAQCVQRLGDLDQNDQVTAATGVSLTAWLSGYGRRTSGDIRMLRAAVRHLARVPSLSAAFDAGQVSWAQVRAVVLQIQRLPARFDDVIDQAVGQAIQGAAGAQPNAIVHTISRHVDALRAQHDTGRPQPQTSRNFMGMQPFADATGGRFFGEVDAEGWALLDAALNRHLPPPAASRQGFAGDPTRDQHPHDPHRAAHDTGRHRLQRLLTILDHTLTGPDTDTHTDTHAGHHDHDHDQYHDHGDDGHDDSDNGGHRGEDDSRPDGSGHHDHGDGGGGGGGGVGRSGRVGDHPDLAGWWAAQRRSRPQLIVRAELDTLLDRSQTPAALLTTLLGGQVTLTAHAARTLIDTRGADLRTIILDDTGAVVGIARRNRIPPGWLRDATLALHDTCSAPTCTTPALVCDTDHATPWHPARPDDPKGRTDIDQLAPLCRRDNAAKERDGWRATQQANGVRRWQHQASGYAMRTLPATWQPPTPSSSPPPDATDPP